MLLHFICIFFIVSTISGDNIHAIHKRNAPELAVYPKPVKNEDQKYWGEVASNELRKALNQSKINTNLAKNIIFFLGDGMGFQTIMAARTYKGQLESNSGEEGSLYFEQFPHIGLSKVYSVDTQVPDSACTATAYLCGVKTNNGVIGVDYKVIRSNCSTMSEESKVSSIAKWSQDAGKRTGFVTTTRVTHATPANMYSHTVERNWEMDANFPNDTLTTCPKIKDIARQLVEDSPGNKLNVVMGGGYQLLNSDAVYTTHDPSFDDNLERRDGRNLIDEWLKSKLSADQKASVVRTRSQLLERDLDNTDFLMGIFANDHLPYAHTRRENQLDMPNLAEMTESAIKVLDKGSEGYFLLVEGGRIDLAHHSGLAKTALDETIDFDNAVQKALEMVDLENTLIIVTADHTHTMSVAGYADRGTPITGIAGEDSDGVSFTTMLYGTGPGYAASVVNETIGRDDPSKSDTSSFNYINQAAVNLESSTHGGEDVPIYAIGPWSHLFYTLHEQNYIPHAMAYASCVGIYKEQCKLLSGSAQTSDSNQNEIAHKYKSFKIVIG